jgi:acetolactate synthase-1/2/3 large subunit
MVKIQQLIKYGRESAVSFGPVDIVKYAEAFGAQGFRVRRPDEIAPVLSRAMGTKGPAIIEVQVDYSENRKLAEVTRSAEIL